MSQLPPCCESNSTPQPAKLIPILPMHFLGQGTLLHKRGQTYSPLYKSNNAKTEKQNLDPVFSEVGSNPVFRQHLKKTTSIAAERSLLPFRFPKLLNQVLINSISQEINSFEGEKTTPSGKILVDMGCLFGFFILFKIIRQWPLSLKRGCLSHSTFPRRCHNCDKEEFIMPQFGAFIIYSL